MALSTVESKAVALTGEKIKTATKKQKILDEDTYTEGIEKIIQQDFYPDLPKLQAQSEYFEALDKNDLVKLRQIQMKYNRPSTGTSSIYNTPATFETPEPQNTSPTKRTEEATVITARTTTSGQTDEDIGKSEKKGSTGVSLDQFLARNTSEDNAAFTEIMVESDNKLKEKHAWWYEHEDKLKQRQQESLALPSIETQAAICDTPVQPVSWEYKAQNALMYVPDCAEFSDKELIEMKKYKPREIIHDNTRFQYNPWNVSRNKEQIRQAAVMKNLVNLGKIGHDGKEVLPTMSPLASGYGFVATPSPAPGVDDSPLMTWGEMEGTPFQLDGGSTPLARTAGPSFKIPEVPSRDRIALELAQKVGQAHRDRKEKALKSVQARLNSPSPKFGRSTTERINSMSPAAQRLVNNTRLGIKTNSDKALRASYTPSPSHSLPGDKTPEHLTPNRTPGSSHGGTPSSTPGSKRESGEVSSITDNLLQLPKRQKAADFF